MESGRFIDFQSAARVARHIPRRDAVRAAAAGHARVRLSGGGGVFTVFLPRPADGLELRLGGCGEYV